MNMILIVGPPAVGKFTIGKNLANRLDYSFIHEHNYLDIIQQFGIEKRSKSLKQYFVLRSFVLRQMIQYTEKKGFVSTMVIDFQDRVYLYFIQTLLKTILPDNSKLILIELSASLSTRLERNENMDRLYHKPSKRDVEKSKKKLVELDECCLFNSKNKIEMNRLKHFRFNTDYQSKEEAVEAIYNTIHL